MFKIYPKWLEFLRIKAIELFQRYSIPRWIVFGLDNLAVFLIFLFAYILRFNFVLTDFEPKLALTRHLLAVSIYAAFELVFRSYSGLIRHTTIIDIFIVFMATSSSLIVLLGLTLLGRKMGWGVTFNIPISIILIHYVTITLLLFFVRIIIKIGFQLISTSGSKKNVLIFGAGDMGVIVKRLINSDIQSSYQISGFLDFNRKITRQKTERNTCF
jgi:FlaA1/EpsC-like NDP-sugar epimerase